MDESSRSYPPVIMLYIKFMSSGTPGSLPWRPALLLLSHEICLPNAAAQE